MNTIQLISILEFNDQADINSSKYLQIEELNVYTFHFKQYNFFLVESELV